MKTKNRRVPRAKNAPKRATKYGSNPAAGKRFTRDGIKFYYEVYGTGEPLLLVHGGGSIADLRFQIDYFRKCYRVIAMDSRDQGKSGDSLDAITYGIEALLLGIRYPTKVKKIAAMSANLNPSEEAVYPEVIALFKSKMDSLPPAVKEDPTGKARAKGDATVLRRAAH